MEFAFVNAPRIDAVSKIFCPSAAFALFEGENSGKGSRNEKARSFPNPSDVHDEETDGDEQNVLERGQDHDDVRNGMHLRFDVHQTRPDPRSDSAVACSIR